MNMLGSLDYKMRHPFQDPDRVKQIHEKVELLMEKERPNPEDFRGIVPDQQIDKDIKNVTMLEKRWSERGDPEELEVKRKADIAEYIIYKLLASWVNQKAIPLLSSKPDDYLRGIDLIIESDMPEDSGDKVNHLGLGIDIALASEKKRSNSFKLKTEKVREILLSGMLDEARYVSSGSYEGTIKNLPYLILSVAPSHVEELLSLASSRQVTEKEEGHILKHIVAYQIIRQLGSYYQFSEKMGRVEMSRSYALALNLAHDLFGHLIDELKTRSELWERVSTDAGVQDIEGFCIELDEQKAFSQN